MAVSQLAPSRYKTKHHRWRGPTCFLYRTTCVGILLQHPKKEYELKMQKKRRRKEETKRGKRKREWRLDHERRPWRGDVSLSLPHSKPFLLCVFPLSSTFSNDFFLCSLPALRRWERREQTVTPHAEMMMKVGVLRTHQYLFPFLFFWPTCCTRSFPFAPIKTRRSARHSSVAN